MMRILPMSATEYRERKQPNRSTQYSGCSEKPCRMNSVTKVWLFMVLRLRGVSGTIRWYLHPQLHVIWGLERETRGVLRKAATMFPSHLMPWHEQYYIDVLGLINQDKYTNMTTGKGYEHSVHKGRYKWPIELIRHHSTTKKCELNQQPTLYQPWFGQVRKAGYWLTLERVPWCKPFKNHIPFEPELSFLRIYPKGTIRSIFKLASNLKVTYTFFFFLGPHLWHMEDARLGVESELQTSAYATATATATQDLSHVCVLHHSSQQSQILNPLSETGIKPTLMDTTWVNNLLNHNGNSKSKLYS